MYTLSIRRGANRSASRNLLVAAVCTTLFTLAACSGSDAGGGGSGTSGGDAAEVAQAKERLAPYLETPTTIPITTPLTEKPPTGKTLYLIRYNIPIGARLDAPHKAAASALGWTLKVLPVDPTDPLSQANAVKQAIAGGADYIEVSSGSAQSIGDGIAAAKKADVPIFLQAGDTPAEGEKNGIYGNSNSGYVNELMIRLLDWAVVDSDGTAGVLNLTTPDYPIVLAATKYLEKEFPKLCSGCSVTTESVSAPDTAAGKAPDLAVAAIRKNPKIKYIVVPGDFLAIGLPQALKAAGIDAKIMVLGASNTMPSGLKNGEYGALAMQSEQAIGWNAVDMAARYSVGMPIDAKEHAVEPGWIWTKDNWPSGQTSFDGPKGYQDQFKELWNVTP